MRLVGHHGHPGQQDDHDSCGTELARAEPELVLAAGESAGLADREVDQRRGAEAEQDPEQQLAEQPRGDRRDLLGQVVSQLLGVGSGVRRRCRGERDQVEVHRRDVHADRQEVDVWKDPVADRRVRAEATVGQEAAADLEVHPAGRRVVREQGEEGSSEHDGQTDPQHPTPEERGDPREAEMLQPGPDAFDVGPPHRVHST